MEIHNGFLYWPTTTKHLENITKNLPIEVDFFQRPSICYASDENDVEKIKTEYDTLKSMDFLVTIGDEMKWLKKRLFPSTVPW